MSAPYYEDELVTLYHGDCLELADLWTGADFMITDPPYGMAHAPRGTYNSATGRTHRPTHGDHIEGDKTLAVRDAALDTWGRERPAIIFGTWRQERPENTAHRLIWWKRGQAPGPARAAFMLQDEEIYVLGKGWLESSPPMRSVLETHEARSQEVSRIGHPTPKPVGLMESLILKCPPAAVIADPFAGSGSTLVAAKALGRKAVGVELEERYCEIAARRLSQGVLDLWGGEAA